MLTIEPDQIEHIDSDAPPREIVGEACLADAALSVSAK